MGAMILTGVLLSLSRALILAPRLMKNLAIGAIPFPDAVCSGVLADRRYVGNIRRGPL